jgi:hypothetical protein
MTGSNDLSKRTIAVRGGRQCGKTAANENPGAGETYEPFCHAPGERCYQMGECYANKQCQHEPTEEQQSFSDDVEKLQIAWRNLQDAVARALRLDKLMGWVSRDGS